MPRTATYLQTLDGHALTWPELHAMLEAWYRRGGRSKYGRPDRPDRARIRSIELTPAGKSYVTRQRRKP